MIEIWVACHGPVPYTVNPPLRLLHVGDGARGPDVLADDTGDTISARNAAYSELTGQYWIWKNRFPQLPDDAIVGFCHYRRFFSYDLDSRDLGEILAIDHAARIDEIFRRGHELILPEPVRFLAGRDFLRESLALRKPVFPWTSLTLYDHYAVNHFRADLDDAVALLPQPHRDGFAAHLAGRRMHNCNNYIARKPILDDYFAFLFPWLFELERRIGARPRDSIQSRVYGFLSERFASYWFGRLPRPYLSKINRLDLPAAPAVADRPAR